MNKKVAFAGILAATLGLGNLGLSSLANTNEGISVLQACNTSALLNIAGLGSQSSDQGECSDANYSDGISVAQLCNTAVLATIFHGDSSAEQGSCGGYGAANVNDGLSILQSCSLAAIVGSGYVGDSSGDSTCGGNENDFISVAQLSDTFIQLGSLLTP